MTWMDVKSGAQRLMESRGHPNPGIGLSALEGLERLLRVHLPEVIGDPRSLLVYGIPEVVDRLDGERRLTSAEQSALSLVFQLVSGEVLAPASPPGDAPGKKEHKLVPLAECIGRLLESHFNRPAPFSLESPGPGLPSVPDPLVYGEVWGVVSAVYKVLVEGRWTLDERLEAFSGSLKAGHQRVDIWFDAPFNCMVEFDETQHFNQFRYRTLQAWRGYEGCSLDYPEYRALAGSVTIPAGTTRFQRLKSFDPLFPPLLEGEAQDNRIRQRAFRDFLKDIAPVVLHGLNPTLRIHYRVTHGRIRDFTKDDLEAVEKYAGRFLERMRVDA